MSIKVSVIVPVYNNNKMYLNRCLHSLVNQTLEEIEIILVNDNSTDGSINILKQYKERYSDKIVLVDLKENKRPGGARNEGINIAKGEYVGFVDSDDYAKKEMFEELYKLAKQGNYDMVDCGFDNVNTGKRAITTKKNTWGELDKEKRSYLIAYPGFVWSKIFKRSILIDNNLRFREKVTYEDIDYLPIAMLYLKSVYASEYVLYSHEDNSYSITNDSSIDIQIKDKMTALRCLVKKFKELNAYEDYKEAVTFAIYNMYIDMLRFYTIGLGKEKVNYEMYKELREFFLELVDYDYHNNQYINLLDKRKKMYAELNNVDYKLIIDTCNNM